MSPKALAVFYASRDHTGVTHKGSHDGSLGKKIQVITAWTGIAVTVCVISL
jgi:hypothetical protein